MNPADLATMLDLLAQALRQMPAAAAGAGVPMAQPAASSGATLSAWIDVHQQLIRDRGYKQQTVKNRMANLAHVRRLWGERAIRALKPHEIATGLKTFGADRTSTAGRVLSELRDVFTEAIANGWTEANPAKDIKPPKHKVQRARLTFETWQAMRTLAETGPQRWVVYLLLLALITGQRRGDLAKMRFDDIVKDAEGREYLRVEQLKQAGKGYGARVEIPLSLRLDAIGMTLADVVEHCRHSAKPGATLLRKAGGGPIEESSLSARFHEHIVAVLGPNAHRRFCWPSLHEVRSLSARLFKAQGIDVQTLLGHKHAEMTELYVDDRGLSKDQWKRVGAQTTLKTPSQACTS